MTLPELMVQQTAATGVVTQLPPAICIDEVVAITAVQPPVKYAAELKNTEQAHYFSRETDTEVPFHVYVNSRPPSAKPLYSAPSSHDT